MNGDQDYYAILQVSRDASQQEIRVAYKRLARDTHPDKNPDADTLERFQAIANAYDTLGNEERRKAYDLRTTTTHKSHAPPPPPPPRQRARAHVRGDNVRLPCVYVQAKDLYAGGVQDIHYRIWMRCTACMNEDTETIRTPCPLCGGARCWHCDNRGYMEEERRPRCGSCRGRRLCESMASVKLVLDGHTIWKASKRHGGGGGCEPIRYERRGSESRFGGPRGDLLVYVTIIGMPTYMEIIEEGHSLRASVAISYLTALLGGVESFPHIDGSEVELEFRPGDDSPLLPGIEYRMEGLGLRTQLGRGDLYVRVKVDPPDKVLSLREFMDVAEETLQLPRKRTHTESQ